MVQIKVNSDKNLVQEIRNKLKENDGYCPCRLSRTKETKCMCKEFRDSVKAGIVGECHCGLYVAE